MVDVAPTMSLDTATLRAMKTPADTRPIPTPPATPPTTIQLGTAGRAQPHHGRSPAVPSLSTSAMMSSSARPHDSKRKGPLQITPPPNASPAAMSLSARPAMAASGRAALSSPGGHPPAHSGGKVQFAADPVVIPAKTARDPKRELAELKKKLKKPLHRLTRSDLRALPLPPMEDTRRQAREQPLFPVPPRSCSRQTGAICYNHYNNGLNPFAMDGDGRSAARQQFFGQTPADRPPVDQATPASMQHNLSDDSMPSDVTGSTPQHGQRDVANTSLIRAAAGGFSSEEVEELVAQQRSVRGDRASIFADAKQSFGETAMVLEAKRRKKERRQRRREEAQERLEQERADVASGGELPLRSSMSQQPGASIVDIVAVSPRNKKVLRENPKAATAAALVEQAARRKSSSVVVAAMRSAEDKHSESQSPRGRTPSHASPVPSPPGPVRGRSPRASCTSTTPALRPSHQRPVPPGKGTGVSLAVLRGRGAGARVPLPTTVSPVGSNRASRANSTTLPMRASSSRVDFDRSAASTIAPEVAKDQEADDEAVSTPSETDPDDDDVDNGEFDEAALIAMEAEFARREAQRKRRLHQRRAERLAAGEDPGSIDDDDDDDDDDEDVSSASSSSVDSDLVSAEPTPRASDHHAPASTATKLPTVPSVYGSADASPADSAPQVQIQPKRRHHHTETKRRTAPGQRGEEKLLKRMEKFLRESAMEKAGDPTLNHKPQRMLELLQRRRRRTILERNQLLLKHHNIVEGRKVDELVHHVMALGKEKPDDPDSLSETRKHQKSQIRREIAQDRFARLLQPKGQGRGAAQRFNRDVRQKAAQLKRSQFMSQAQEVEHRYGLSVERLWEMRREFEVMQMQHAFMAAMSTGITIIFSGFAVRPYMLQKAVGVDLDVDFLSLLKVVHAGTVPEDIIDGLYNEFSKEREALRANATTFRDKHDLGTVRGIERAWLEILKRFSQRPRYAATTGERGVTEPEWVRYVATLRSHLSDDDAREMFRRHAVPSRVEREMDRFRRTVTELKRPSKGTSPKAPGAGGAGAGTTNGGLSGIVGGLGIARASYSTTGGASTTGSLSEAYAGQLDTPRRRVDSTRNSGASLKGERVPSRLSKKQQRLSAISQLTGVATSRRESGVGLGVGGGVGVTKTTERAFDFVESMLPLLAPEGDGGNTLEGEGCMILTVEGFAETQM